MNTIKLFLALVAMLLLLDFIWLGVLMKDFYNQQLGELARRDGSAMAPRWPAAIIVYALIPLGIVVFVRPLVHNLPLWPAIGYGACYGLVLYGVYDLTNRAVLAEWSLLMTMVDIAWGSFICTLLTLAARWLE